MTKTRRGLALLIAFALGCALIPQVAFAADNAAMLAAGAIEVSAPKSVREASPHVKYRAYQNSGWTKSWTAQGKAVGKAGKTLELLRVKVEAAGISGSVKYRIYSKYKGWQEWKSNGRMVGAKGWKFRGVQMKLTGGLGKYFDIAYRVYLADEGWRPWSVNGATAGSTGSLGEVQRFQAKLVRKGISPKIAAGAYFITPAKKPTAALAVPKSSAKSGVQMVRAIYKDTAFNERFFVRRLSDGTVRLQSCASGLYLCERNGKVVQRPLITSKKLCWIVRWNDGYVLVNAATGHYFALSNGKAVCRDTPYSWQFTMTSVIPNGTFELRVKDSGETMAVDNGSKNNRAAIVMDDTAKAGAKSFVLKHLGSNVFRISNAYSGKYVEVKNGSASEGASVRQNALKYAPLQKWKAKLDSDGGFSFINRASGKVLSVEASGTVESRVVSSADTAKASQRWALAVSSYKKPQVGPDSGPGAIAAARSEQFARTISSSTQYFIAVDLTNHWVCIYKGSAGNRVLFKSYQCSCGKPSSPTPAGEYTIARSELSEAVGGLDSVDGLALAHEFLQSQEASL